MLRNCNVHGCPELSQQSRCERHRRDAERARGSRQERGYDAEYQAQLQSPEYLAATHCANCKEPFTEDNPKTGGHSVAIRQGGRGSRIVPHCRRCNYGWRRTNL